MGLPPVFDIKPVVDIAVEAGKRILEISRDADKWDIKYKGLNDPVTAADQSAHECICAGLSKLKGLESIPILSEEGVLPDHEIRKDWVHFWSVDPLDGTKEFINQSGEYTVNIALCHRGKPVAGVIYVPETGEKIWAIEGSGTFYQCEGDAEPKRVFCDKFAWDQKDLIVVTSRTHGLKETKVILDKLNIKKVIYAGSSIKFIRIAIGAAHLYPRMAPTSEWDTCAAHIIINEAGGQIRRVNEHGEVQDDELAYNKPNLLNPYFVAVGKMQKSLSS